MIDEIKEIHEQLYKTHGKQILDLAVLRILGSSLLNTYAKQYQQDVSEPLGLMLALIDEKSRSLGSISAVVAHVARAAETVGYIKSIPDDLTIENQLLQQEKKALFAQYTKLVASNAKLVVEHNAELAKTKALLEHINKT